MTNGDIDMQRTLWITLVRLGLAKNSLEFEMHLINKILRTVNGDNNWLEDEEK